MKRSQELMDQITTINQRIDALYREADVNEPISFTYRPSRADYEENERRRARCQQISRLIDQLRSEVSELGRQRLAAIEEERRPPPLQDSQTIVDLTARKAELEATVATAREERAAAALAASEGDATAKTKLNKAIATERNAITELENLRLAIDAAKLQQREERQEFNERDADARFIAAKAAADDLITWAEKFDNHLSYLAAHFAKLPELQNALAKSGASINTDLTNRLYPAAARDRAAKAAGLHRCFSLDATVQAAPLGDAFRSLLKAAVRRPEIERKQA